MHSWHAAGYLLPADESGGLLLRRGARRIHGRSRIFSRQAGSHLPTVLLRKATLVTPDPDFVEAARFSGELRGYIFKADDYGLGYYKDQPPPPRVTLSIKEEQRAKRVSGSRNDMPKFDSISSS